MAWFSWSGCAMLSKPDKETWVQTKNVSIQNVCPWGLSIFAISQMPSSTLYIYVVSLPNESEGVPSNESLPRIFWNTHHFAKKSFLLFMDSPNCHFWQMIGTKPIAAIYKLLRTEITLKPQLSLFMDRTWWKYDGFDLILTGGFECVFVFCIIRRS